MVKLSCSSEKEKKPRDSSLGSPISAPCPTCSDQSGGRFQASSRPPSEGQRTARTKGLSQLPAAFQPPLIPMWTQLRPGPGARPAETESPLEAPGPGSPAALGLRCGQISRGLEGACCPRPLPTSEVAPASPAGIPAHASTPSAPHTPNSTQKPKQSQHPQNSSASSFQMLPVTSLQTSRSAWPITPSSPFLLPDPNPRSHLRRSCAQRPGPRTQGVAPLPKACSSAHCQRTGPGSHGRLQGRGSLPALSAHTLQTTHLPPGSPPPHSFRLPQHRACPTRRL